MGIFWKCMIVKFLKKGIRVNQGLGILMFPLCLIANSFVILAAQTLTIIVISRQLEEFFFVLCELSFSSSSSSEPLQKWCRVLYYERETPATVKRRVNWVCLQSFRTWFENSRKSFLKSWHFQRVVVCDKMLECNTFEI